MKIPEIVTRHKIRDAKICSLWVHDLLTTDEIGERFHLCARRIQKIIFDNREFVKFNKGWERTKRIKWLKVQIKRAGNSSKDSADLLDRLKVELEGNAPLVDNSQHFHFTKLDDKALIDTARKEGISLPPAIEERIGASSEEQPA